MSSLLNKLKDKLVESNQNPIQSTTVEIPKDAKHFVCKNHFNIDNKGREVVTRTIINFLPNEISRTCECGIIYKRVL